MPCVLKNWGTCIFEWLLIERWFPTAQVNTRGQSQFSLMNLSYNCILLKCKFVFTALWFDWTKLTAVPDSGVFFRLHVSYILNASTGTIYLTKWQILLHYHVCNLLRKFIHPFIIMLLFYPEKALESLKKSKAPAKCKPYFSNNLWKIPAHVNRLDHH